MRHQKVVRFSLEERTRVVRELGRIWEAVAPDMEEMHRKNPRYCPLNATVAAQTVLDHYDGCQSDMAAAGREKLRNASWETRWRLAKEATKRYF